MSFKLAALALILVGMTPVLVNAMCGQNRSCTSCKNCNNQGCGCRK